MKPILTVFLFLLFAHPIQAQDDLPDFFVHKLAAAGLEFYQPVEQTFRQRKREKKPFYPTDLTLFKKREAFEIRYKITLEGDHPLLPNPHALCMLQASHVASNDEEALMAVHRIDEMELRETFGADWGAVIFFQPKDQFSPRNHCKMLTVFKEGKGMFTVFFLFDKPGEELGNYWQNMRFEDYRIQ